MEGEVMDEETRRISEMSDEELNARFERGTPAKIAGKMPRRIRRKQALDRRAAAIVAQATDGGSIEWDVASVSFEGLSIGGRNDKPFEIPSQSDATVRP
jgi:hypothetical protein